MPASTRLHCEERGSNVVFRLCRHVCDLQGRRLLPPRLPEPVFACPAGVDQIWGQWAAEMEALSCILWHRLPLYFR